MTAEQIAELIEELQAGVAASYLNLLFLNAPELDQLLRSRGLDAGSTIHLGRRDGSSYSGIEVWNSINLVRGNPRYNLNFLRSQIMTMTSWIGHELMRKGYFDKTPELEFLRHLRNGLSHGNKFYFRNGEPKRPARFKTFEITRGLQGQAVAFDFINTGDFFDLFDHLKAHLRGLRLP